MKLKNLLFTCVVSQVKYHLWRSISPLVKPTRNFLPCSPSLILATWVRVLSECNAPGQGFWEWELHLYSGQSPFPSSFHLFCKYLLITSCIHDTKLGSEHTVLNKTCLGLVLMLLTVEGEEWNSSSAIMPTCIKSRWATEWISHCYCHPQIHKSMNLLWLFTELCRREYSLPL